MKSEKVETWCSQTEEVIANQTSKLQNSGYQSKDMKSG